MDRYLRLSVNDYEFTHAGPCGSGVFISAGTFRKTGFIRRKNVIKWKDTKGGRNMVIRETKKEDLKQVMEIIRMAQKLFKESGINQWQDGYPNKEVLLGDIRKRQSYVAEEEGRLIGTAVLSPEGESTYEKIEKGEWLTGPDADYVVIHRIATHSDYKRRGTAGSFLKKAEDLGREHGAGSIRIDTHPDNRIMQNWLKKNGFSYCGWIWLVTGDLRYAYEKLL